MKQLLLRLQALLLATIFVSGSFGLPEADVLLDHGIDRGAARTQIHIEDAGGCADHSDHCVLGRLLADLRDLAPAEGPQRPIDPAGQSARYRVAYRLIPKRPALSYRSRAPPTLS